MSFAFQMLRHLLLCENRSPDDSDDDTENIFFHPIIKPKYSLISIKNVSIIFTMSRNYHITFKSGVHLTRPSVLISVAMVRQ